MITQTDCRVYWGSHGCDRPPGHDGPHMCGCCSCETDSPTGSHNPETGLAIDPDDGGEYICPAKPPYYGPETNFYGDDA